MAITLVNDSATIGTTEYFLASDSTTKVDQTDDCMLQAWIDFGALVAGDRYEVRVYEKINAGTQGLALYEAILDGVQAELFKTPALIVGEAWEVSVQKTSGTDRAIGWSLRKVTGTLTFVNDAATIGTTEYWLASDSTTKTDQTDDKQVQVWIDFGAMAAGDRYKVRIVEKVNAGTQANVEQEAILDGVQPNFFVTPALILGDAWEVGVQKLAGTDRSIGWSLRKAS